MYNIEEIIVEKFVEGRLDEVHFLNLYEYDSTAAAVTAAANNITRQMVYNAHEQEIRSFKRAKMDYKVNMAKAKECIKKADGEKAKKYIKEAIGNIEDCEKIIKDADDDLVSILATDVSLLSKLFLAEIIVLAAAVMAQIDTEKSENKYSPKAAKTATTAVGIVGGAAGIAAIAIIIKDCKNLMKYKNQGLTNTIHRANVLASLDKCKKNLEKLESKIAK